MLTLNVCNYNSYYYIVAQLDMLTLAYSEKVSRRGLQGSGEK